LFETVQTHPQLGLRVEREKPRELAGRIGSEPIGRGRGEPQTLRTRPCSLASTLRAKRFGSGSGGIAIPMLFAMIRPSAMILFGSTPRPFIRASACWPIGVAAASESWSSSACSAALAPFARSFGAASASFCDQRLDGGGGRCRRSEPQATNKRSPSRSTSGQGSGAGDTVMVSNSSSPANAAGATLPNFVASTSKCFSKAAAIAACLIATS